MLERIVEPKGINIYLNNFNINNFKVLNHIY